MKSNMKICVLSTLWNFDNAYSLTSVIESQLTSIVKNGYEAVLFTHDNFDEDDKVPKGVEIRKIVPRFVLEDYTDHHQVTPEFEKNVKEIEKILEKNMEDIDIVFEHDLIFQGWFLPYCVAIHNIAERTKIKWFHWIHSVPNLRPANIEYPHTLRYQLPKNSKLVYLNNYHHIRAAESYSAWPKDVKIVYNPVDPRLFWNLHPLTKSLLDKYPVLEADFIQVYPLSTTRMMDGKQLGTVIEIFGQLKKQGNKVCLIVCNAHANAPKEKETIERTILQAQTYGLTTGELIFTSFESPDYESGVPKEVVSQLFLLANLFIFPSRSENCSLVLLEAMLSKNLLVLNDSVPPMREFGRECAIYFRFGGLDEHETYADRERFTLDVAKIIISEFHSNKALNGSRIIRQQFNYDYIFKNMIEPIIQDDKDIL